MIARGLAGFLFLLLALAVPEARALPPVPADSNGDRRSELLWRAVPPATGVSWWIVNGATVIASAYHEAGQEWQVAAAADVTGDGKSDLVWRRASDGAAFLWVLDGTTPTAFVDIGIAGGYQWELAGAGDLDGDGDADLVWRKSDGLVWTWLMQAGAIASQQSFLGLDPGWPIRAVADMDGDGKADLVFHQAITGEVVVWFMDGQVVRGASIAGALPPAEWTLAAAADANGDGRADLVWRHTDGSLYFWKLDGAAVSAMQPLPDPGATWALTGP